VDHAGNLDEFDGNAGFLEAFGVLFAVG